MEGLKNIYREHRKLIVALDGLSAAYWEGKEKRDAQFRRKKRLIISLAVVAVAAISLSGPLIWWLVNHG